MANESETMLPMNGLRTASRAIMRQSWARLARGDGCGLLWAALLPASWLLGSYHLLQGLIAAVEIAKPELTRGKCVLGGLALATADARKE